MKREPCRGRSGAGVAHLPGLEHALQALLLNLLAQRIEGGAGGRRHAHVQRARTRGYTGCAQGAHCAK